MATASKEEIKRIKTYVITSPPRMEIVQQNWGDQKVEIFEAVYIQKLKNWVMTSTCKPDSNQLTAGELGCALSHYLVAKKAVRKRHDFTLILEDDVERREGWREDLSSLLGGLDIDVAHLCSWKLPEDYHAHSKNRTIISQNPRLETGYDEWGGTVAILYSRKALKVLVSYMENKSLPCTMDGLSSRLSWEDMWGEESLGGLKIFTTGILEDRFFKGGQHPSGSLIGYNKRRQRKRLR